MLMEGLKEVYTAQSNLILDCYLINFVRMREDGRATVVLDPSVGVKIDQSLILCSECPRDHFGGSPSNEGLVVGLLRERERAGVL